MLVPIEVTSMAWRISLETKCAVEAKLLKVSPATHVLVRFERRINCPQGRVLVMPECIVFQTIQHLFVSEILGIGPYAAAVLCAMHVESCFVQTWTRTVLRYEGTFHDKPKKAPSDKAVFSRHVLFSKLCNFQKERTPKPAKSF